MNENVSAWLSAVDGLPEAHQRLRRVEVRNESAIQFIRRYDHANGVLYCDPPYLHSTRSVTDAYAVEMSEADHEELLKTLASIEGRFLLSGYDNDLYRRYAKKYNWRTVTKLIDNKSSGKKIKDKKMECLWMNY